LSPLTATDAAKQAADILLTSPGLSAIYVGVVESRKIFKRLRTYVIYRIAATIQIVVFLAFVIFHFNAKFNPLYILLLALLNDLSQMAIAYDLAIPKQSPEKPTVYDLLLTAGTTSVCSTKSYRVVYAAPSHSHGLCMRHQVILIASPWSTGCMTARGVGNTGLWAMHEAS
jgi:magnesium-transporting ATPase (P-type)